jgi:hypothetical protein
MNFSPGLTDRSKEGRWITFVEADMDQDGFEDIILGSFTGMEISRDLNPYADSSIPLLFVRNLTK